jgi:hypothetical protein
MTVGMSRLCGVLLLRSPSCFGTYDREGLDWRAMVVFVAFVLSCGRKSK